MGRSPSTRCHNILMIFMKDSSIVRTTAIKCNVQVPWHCNTCGMNVAGDQVGLSQLEDAPDSLKIVSRVDVVGREIDQDLFTIRSTSWKEDVWDSFKKE